eukprot:5312273-Prorocentrum_lima.AAC.1
MLLDAMREEVTKAQEHFLSRGDEGAQEWMSRRIAEWTAQCRNEDHVPRAHERAGSGPPPRPKP